MCVCLHVPEVEHVPKLGAVWRIVCLGMHSLLALNGPIWPQCGGQQRHILHAAVMLPFITCASCCFNGLFFSRFFSGNLLPVWPFLFLPQIRTICCYSTEECNVYFCLRGRTSLSHYTTLHYPWCFASCRSSSAPPPCNIRQKRTHGGSFWKGSVGRARHYQRYQQQQRTEPGKAGLTSTRGITPRHAVNRLRPPSP